MSAGISTGDEQDPLLAVRDLDRRAANAADDAHHDCLDIVSEAGEQADAILVLALHQTQALDRVFGDEPVYESVVRAA